MYDIHIFFPEFALARQPKNRFDVEIESARRVRPRKWWLRLRLPLGVALTHSRDQLIPSAEVAALRRNRQVERLCREIYRDDSGNVGGREPISGNEGARGQARIEISVEISYSQAPTLNDARFLVMDPPGFG